MRDETEKLFKGITEESNSSMHSAASHWILYQEKKHANSKDATGKLTKVEHGIKKWNEEHCINDKFGEKLA